MNIQIGKVYLNKTFKYLIPCLKVYGDTFQAKLSTVHKLAFGIHDCYFDGTKMEEKKLIYMLCDKAYQKAKFLNFLNYVQHQDYYETDYPYDDMLHGRKHMIVLKIPEEHINAYDAFREGRYSEMYSSADIDKLFDMKVHPIREVAIAIMTKEKIMKQLFRDKLNTSLGTTITLKDINDENMELDFPLEKKKEFFNYKESDV